jgi:hypothetical protein
LSVRFAAYGNERGLDPAAVSGSGGLVVPLGGSARVRVIGATSGVTVRTTAAHLTVTELRRRHGDILVGVRSTGGPVPYNTIEAMSGSSVLAQLYVYGLAWREVPVIACSVGDSARASRRPLASLATLLEGANRYLTPQACVTLVPWLTAEARLDRDYGPAFTVDDGELSRAVRPIRVGPEYCVRLFFVREIRGSTRRDTAGYGVEGDFVAIEDHISNAALALAHEIGHFFLGNDHSGSQRNLMFESIPNGGRLTFSQAIAMNGRAARYAVPPTARRGTVLDPIEIVGGASR